MVCILFKFSLAILYFIFCNIGAVHFLIIAVFVVLNGLWILADVAQHPPKSTFVK